MFYVSVSSLSSSVHTASRRSLGSIWPLPSLLLSIHAKRPLRSQILSKMSMVRILYHRSSLIRRNYWSPEIETWRHDAHQHDRQQDHYGKEGSEIWMDISQVISILLECWVVNCGSESSQMSDSRIQASESSSRKFSRILSEISKNTYMAYSFVYKPTTQRIP